MKKIYTLNNDLYIEDTVSGELMGKGSSSSLFEITKKNVNDTIYQVYKDGFQIGELKIGQLQKEDTSLFTMEEFDTWKSENVGKSNPGVAGLPEPITQAEYDALPASKESDDTYYFIIENEE